MVGLIGEQLGYVDQVEDSYIVKVHSAGELVDVLETRIDVLPRGIK